VSESGGNDKVQYARYLGCHSSGTPVFLLRDVLGECLSLLISRTQCKRRSTLHALDVL
jgi:hypothetical protein